jgi:hypothetical protein
VFTIVRSVAKHDEFERQTPSISIARPGRLRW